MAHIVRSGLVWIEAIVLIGNTNGSECKSLEKQSDLRVCERTYTVLLQQGRRALEDDGV